MPGTLSHHFIFSRVIFEFKCFICCVFFCYLLGCNNLIKNSDLDRAAKPNNGI